MNAIDSLHVSMVNVMILWETTIVLVNLVSEGKIVPLLWSAVTNMNVQNIPNANLFSTTKANININASAIPVSWAGKKNFYFSFFFSGYPWDYDFHWLEYLTFQDGRKKRDLVDWWLIVSFSFCCLLQTLWDRNDGFISEEEFCLGASIWQSKRRFLHVIVL